MRVVFDIGGTNLRAGGFSRDHQLLTKRIERTPAQYEQGLTLVGKLVSELVSSVQERVEGIALAIAGILDPDKHQILVSPNLANWVKKPLRSDLSQILNLPVVMENDAVAAGLGEANFGAGKERRIVAYLTIGTGVGGARIVGGKADVSAYGFEPGYQIINLDEAQSVGQFLRGGLEAYCSGVAFETLYGMRPEQCDDTFVWQQYSQNLAAGINNVIILWSPDIVVLGGGLTKSADKFLPLLQKYIDEYVVFPQKPPVVIGALGDDAGLWGGIVLLH